MDSEIVSSLKKRYANIPPFVLNRSIERAKSVGELFDILDTIPELPICWDSEERRWVRTPLLSGPPRSSKSQRSEK